MASKAFIDVVPDFIAPITKRLGTRTILPHDEATAYDSTPECRQRGCNQTETRRTAAKKVHMPRVVTASILAMIAGACTGPTTSSHQDGEPPSGPSRLVATALSPSQVLLSWNRGTDDVGVVEYAVSRFGTEIASVPDTMYIDSGLAQSTTYSYTVRARDAAGNESPASASASATTSSPTNDTFGVLGDSNSDEYRADDNRGGAYASTTLNWIELLASLRGLDFGAWDTNRGEPRRSGFAYNWARSGATAATMISSGQHLGLAQQVANGDVSNVILYIGVNDFSVGSGQYARIYDGTVSGQALQDKIDGFISDVTEAVDVVLAAGPVRVLPLTVSDPGLDPATMTQFPDANRRQLVTDAIGEVNAGLSDLAASRGLILGDLDVVAQELRARADANGFIDIGGEPIDLNGRGDEPHNIRLGDSVGHPGTVASGLFANLVVIDAFSREYGLDIVPLAEQELLAAAGII